MVDGVNIPYTSEDDEICDSQNGNFPLEYYWYGSHPNCRCSILSILLPKSVQYKIINGNPVNVEKYRIKDIPQKLKDWIIRHKIQMEGWKSLPDWYINNLRFFA